MQVGVRDAGSIPESGSRSRRAQQPTPVLLSRERQGQRSLVALVHGVAQLDMTEVAEYPRWHL